MQTSAFNKAIAYTYAKTGARPCLMIAAAEAKYIRSIITDVHVIHHHDVVADRLITVLIVIQL